MASEDHNIEGPAEEPQAPLPASDAAAHPDADLDLFDFPVVESPFADTTVDPLAEPAPASTITQAPAPADEPALSELMSVDEPEFDLDEDLFNFAELFTATESEAGDEAIRAFSEPGPTDGDAPGPGDAAAPDAGPEVPAGREVPAEPTAASPAPAPQLATADDMFAGREFDLAPLLVGAVQPTEAEARSERASIIRDNLIEVLVVLFLSVNAALIVFAWQANTSFRSTLDGVRTDIADTLRDVGTSELLAAEPTHGETAPQPVPDEAPTPLASYAELELGLAREALTNGRYAVARGRLYRLLSNQDRFPVSAELLAEAEYLIADSYFEEGRALGGSSR